MCVSVVVGCPVLEDPINGTVVVSGRTVGSVANYTCVSGHLLTGVMIRECLVTGEWSDQAPICESMLITHKSTTILHQMQSCNKSAN